MCLKIKRTSCVMAGLRKTVPVPAGLSAETVLVYIAAA